MKRLEMNNKLKRLFVPSEPVLTPEQIDSISEFWGQAEWDLAVGLAVRLVAKQRYESTTVDEDKRRSAAAPAACQVDDLIGRYNSSYFPHDQRASPARIAPGGRRMARGEAAHVLSLPPAAAPTTWETFFGR
jgi:hypothetical protein